MMLCAEWGVRSGVVPPSLYERFVAKLDPSETGPDSQGTSLNRGRLTSWLCRCATPLLGYMLLMLTLTLALPLNLHQVLRDALGT